MLETLLIVNMDPSRLRMAELVIQQKLSYRTITTSNAEETVERLRSGKLPQPEAILLDLPFSGQNGLNLIRTVRGLRPQMPIIVLIKYGNREQIAGALQHGASDFLIEPVDVDRLRCTLQQAFKMQRMSHYISWLERKLAGHMDLTDVVGKSPLFRQALAQASEAAASKKPVWIVGEPGTGKALFARTIHGSSDRAGKPFIVVNCEIMPAHLAESLLFGQENPSPASQLHFSLGKLREADQGTLLLEEIGALPQFLQRKLAEVLEKGMVVPIGGNAPHAADIRLIATSRTIPSSTFNPAGIEPRLHQCLKGAVISLPSLRQRTEDLMPLVEHFLVIYSTSENKYIRGLSEQARQWLASQAWPGNVHQLGNLLWRTIMLCESEMISAGDLQLALKSRSVLPVQASPEITLPGAVDEQGRVRTLKSVQEEAIRFALQHTGGCMTRAARSLGIGRSTLYRKVSQLDEGCYISRANQTTRPMMKVSSIERS
jgi:DNA-binding NtrC family response regulator